jgi:universal stress protein E
VRRARQGFDLIMIGTRRRRALGRLVLEYNDRALVRDCAEPLLIAKSQRSYEKIRVLAAVDPFHRHAAPSGLDTRVIGWARAFARLFGGSVDLIHAVPEQPLQVRRVLRPYAVRADPAALERMRSEAERTVRRLAREHRIPPGRVHVESGHPIDVIARAAERGRCHLVVMGVVARGVIERLRFGSTAETLLDDLQCDILAIKPRGFRSPVPVRAG